MADWNFTPTHISYGDTNDGATENPDNKPDEDGCPLLEATPAFCDPQTSGILKLKMKLDSPSGCELYPPVYARVYATNETLDKTPEGLITQFPAALNQEYSFSVEPGTYLVHLSGKYKSEKELSVIVDQVGIFVTGLQFTHQPAPDCLTTTPVKIKWTGWNDFEINTEPTVFGRSDSGTTVPATPGEYEIKFSRNGCESVSKFKVGNSNPISVQVSGTGWTCAGNGLDGRLFATATGGSAPYSYAWFSGVGVGQDISWEGPIGFGRTITGLGDGFYMVGVFDSIGCEGTGRGSVGPNNNRLGVDTVFTSKAKNTICCQEALTTFASICAMASGGYPPYQYLWADGQTGVCATGLSKGTHFVTITDKSGCQVTSNAEKIEITNECLLVKWDFGNGNIQEYIALPLEVYSGVKNPYQLPGNYNVKMMVVNGYQESGIACKNVEVPACPPLSYIELTTYPDCMWGSAYPIQYTATMYDSDFGVLAGVQVEVRHHSVDTGKAPYNEPGYPIPPFFDPAFNCSLAPNVVSGERQLLTSNEFGQVIFTRTTRRCECISVIAKTFDNPVGLVPNNVSSRIACFANCPRDPGDNDPSSSSGDSESSENPPPPPPSPPPPSPPPSPPPPSPPPGPGSDSCPCCVPQADGSSRCEMRSREDCAAAGGAVQTLNGLSTAACFGSCADVPGMITDCYGNVLCREPKGKCCTSKGCSTATPCECKQFGGTYFFSERGLGRAEEDCNDYCYVSCCYPNGSCAESTAVAVGPTRQACMDAQGAIVSDCSSCSSSSSSSSSSSPSSSSSSGSSDSSDYYA